jgi:GntR family transcriptional regulator/MocR family aminotransferase
MRTFTIDRASSLPLIRQIYREISSQILRGEMASGERLPSTRETAGELGVSRNVVIEAYEQLAAEGFLIGIEGAGTFVAEGSMLAPRAFSPAPLEARTLGAAAIAAEAGGEAPGPAGLVDFRLGRPALDLFPRRVWARLEYEARLGAGPEALGSAPPEGSAELRSALCSYLRRRRGLECDPGRIVVTSGALHGLSILSSLLLGPGAEAIVEDPGYVLAREIFEDSGAAAMPVPVDEEGLRVELLPRGGKPALAFVTPSHQFPLGGCLSIQRRIALVEWARESGCLLVEDDYESEFRYDVGPVSALQRLDPDNVAYVGTFSKIFFPALRLGYLVLPARLVDSAVERKRLRDRYQPPAPQLAMARFIEEGRLDRHIARMRKAYRGRRDALAEALESSFPGRVKTLGMATGLHVAASFEGIDFDAALVGELRRSGVAVHPIEDYAIAKGLRRGCLAMGYSHLTEGEIGRGVAALARTLAGRGPSATSA